MSALATASLVVLCYILARLSERFGSVLKMPPLYKRYYLAEAFVALAFLAHLVRASMFLSGLDSILGLPVQLFMLIFYHLPLAVGMTIALLTTWTYWGWLITERKKPNNS